MQPPRSTPGSSVQGHGRGLAQTPKYTCTLSAGTFGRLLLQDLSGPWGGAFRHVDNVLSLHLRGHPPPLGGDGQALLPPGLGSWGRPQKGTGDLLFPCVSRAPSLPCYLSPLSLMAHKALSCVSLCQHPNSMGQLESSMGGKVVQSSSRAGHQTPNPSFMHSREVPESWVLSPSYVKILLLWYLEPHPCGVQG